MKTPSMDPSSAPIIQTAIGGISMESALGEIVESTQVMAEGSEIVVDLSHQREDCYTLTIGQKSTGLSEDRIIEFITNMGATAEGDDIYGMFMLCPFRICGINGKYLVRSKTKDGEEFKGMVTPSGLEVVDEKINGPENVSFETGMFLTILFSSDRPFSVGRLHTKITEKSEEQCTDIRYTISDKDRGDTISTVL